MKHRPIALMKYVKIRCISLHFGSDVLKWLIIITYNLYYAFILKVPKLGQLSLPYSCPVACRSRA